MNLNTDRLRSQLILEEGLRLVAYDDATGKPVPEGGVCEGNLTVGVGHNLDANPLTPQQLASVGHDGRTQPITHDDAINILDDDCIIAELAIEHHLPWCEDLDEIRQRVLVDMTFNMGIVKLMAFNTFLSLLEAHNFEQAASDLASTAWYHQVGSRARRLVAMVSTGQDYTA